MADNSTFSPGSGSTVTGSTTSSADRGFSGSSQSGSSNFSDTSRPTGSTTSSSTSGSSPSYSGSGFQPDTGSDRQDFTPQNSGYQRSSSQTIYAERPRSRPSNAVIAGAALAGALTAGAIPFLLAGRKSSQKNQLTTYGSRDTEYGSRGTEFEGGENRPALFNQSGTPNRS